MYKYIFVFVNVCLGLATFLVFVFGLLVSIQKLFTVAHPLISLAVVMAFLASVCAVRKYPNGMPESAKKAEGCRVEPGKRSALEYLQHNFGFDPEATARNLKEHSHICANKTSDESSSSNQDTASAERARGSSTGKNQPNNQNKKHKISFFIIRNDIFQKQRRVVQGIRQCSTHFIQIQKNVITFFNNLFSF